MAKAPTWAIDLVQQIAIDQELHKPELVWRRAGKSAGWSVKEGGEVRLIEGTRRKGSSGSTALDGSNVVVTAGADRSDQRTTLIHEMAHVAAGPKEWHSANFYRIAWRFYGLYAPNVSTRTLLQREGSYKVTALKVAEELGLHGAKAALARERAKPKPGRFVHYNS